MVSDGPPNKPEFSIAVCRLTSQWSGRLRATRSGAAHRRVRHRELASARYTPNRPANPRSPMELTAVLTHAEEGGFVALNPETGTTTQGDTVEEAFDNLREATALYLEEFPLSVKGPPLVTMFTVPEHA